MENESEYVNCGWRGVELINETSIASGNISRDFYVSSEAIWGSSCNREL